MEPKAEIKETKFSISRINYSEYKTTDSQLIIECDYITAAKILEFISKLKTENAK